MNRYSLKRTGLTGIPFAVLLIAAILLSGCSNSTGPDFVMPVKLAAAFEGSQLNSNVSRVELTITAGDITFLTRNVPFESGRVNVVVDVTPGQNINFSLVAFDDDERVLYSGSATDDVGLGQDVTVNIQMVPQVLMLKVDPVFQPVSPNTDNLKYFDIYVYNVEDLFGASFRIEYDNDIIAPTEVVIGPFLGDSPQSLARIQPEYVAVGITRTQGESGISGSGRLARVFFEPVIEGTTQLTFNTSTVSLGDPSGNPVNEFSTLVLENGEVSVVSLIIE